MKNRAMTPLVRAELIVSRICFVRGCKVMLDRDLADLYHVETKALNQAVKRNPARFPEDFMFQLNRREAAALLDSRSQNVTLKKGSNIKYLPYVFTEQGVAMLSSVLRSKRAMAVNVEIMRTFVRMRHVLASHKELARRLDEIETLMLRKFGAYDRAIAEVFKTLHGLMNPPQPPKRPIGFIELEERHPPTPRQAETPSH